MTTPTATFYDGKAYPVLGSVGHQLSQVMQLMRREVELRMARYELTDAQWKPLLALGSGWGRTPNELARATDIDPGAMTRLLDRLVAKGLVERERCDNDRRCVNLALTAAGHEKAAQVPHVLAAVNNDYLAGFSVAEWEQLRALLDRLLANGQALQQPQERQEEAA